MFQKLSLFHWQG